MIAEYLEHRQRREQQTLALVADGLTEADVIAERLYRGVTGGLERAARMTVQAHLDKLREDDRFV